MVFPTKRIRKPLGFIAILGMLLLPLGVNALPAHSGDIDDNGTRNILDITCYANAALSIMQGTAAPSCQALSTEEVDLQCNGSLDITDVQRSILLTLYGITGDGEIGTLLSAKDPDLDLVHNGCDEDDDNDSFPDVCEEDQGTSPIDPSSIPTTPNACTCPGGCEIEGLCIENGSFSPDTPCLVCSSTTDPNGWSPQEGASCDDGDACTVVDVCSGGTCEGSVPLTCGGGGECEGATCIPEVGCVVLPVTGGFCDDGDACTVTATCLDGTCVGGDPVDCSDDNPCTAEECNSAAGCLYPAASSGISCDDGDDCTIGDGCVDGICSPGSLDPSCIAPPDTVCTLTGAPLAEVECSIYVARATAPTPTPSALQFSLEYDPTQVAPIGVIDELCVGGGGFCFDSSVPPSALYPSGHSVSLAPQNLVDWSGLGTLVLANPSDPNAAISPAIYDPANPTGEEAKVLRVKFVLLADLETTGSYVTVSSGVGASASALPLEVNIESEVIVVSGGGCTADSDCEDGLTCTDATCDTSLGICTYTNNTSPCDDGNVCTGGDTCFEGVCEGTALDCDDENACTIDSCLSEIGCSHGDIQLNCEDGNLCTDDACEPTTGFCGNTPNTNPCDDGDPCTLNDTCGSGLCSPGIPAPRDCVAKYNPLCTLSGLTGEEIVCPIRVARLGEASPPAAALQATLSFDSSKVALVDVTDEVCFGAICVDTSTPPSNLYPSGHSVALAPGAVANWSGGGTLVLSNPANPTAPLNLAYESTPGALIEGDTPEIISLKFTMIQDVTSPTHVTLNGATGATASGASMGVIVRNETILLKVDGCLDAPEVCDDGISCKTSICATGSSCCESSETGPGCDDPICEAAVCGLDPFCCSSSWDAACISCAIMGKGAGGLDCSAAQASCALDCDVATGGTCEHGVNSDSCDDGDACTSNICDPVLGCTTEEICGGGE